MEVPWDMVSCSQGMHDAVPPRHSGADFSLDSVSNFTVIDNLSTAKHLGSPTSFCDNQVPNHPPIAFLADLDHTIDGVRQDDFAPGHASRGR